MQLRSKQDFWILLAILVVAGALRWWAIEIKPVHFDAGINGCFAGQMQRPREKGCCWLCGRCGSQLLYRKQAKAA